MFRESIINLNSKFNMWKLQQICNDYARHLDIKLASKGQTILFDFKKIISSFCKGEVKTQQKNNLIQAHTAFLLQKLGQFPLPQNINFTALLQLTNFTFRSNPHLKINFPSSLMTSLANHLRYNSIYLTSPAVVTNIIWLICKLVQGSFSKELALRNMIESRLLEVCINGGALEETAQKGISLLLGYMCKRQLLNTQIYLTLFSNLSKFHSIQCLDQILAVLSQQQSLNILRQNREKIFQVRSFFEYFLKELRIEQKFIKVNWKLALLVAQSSPELIVTLRVRQIIVSLIMNASLNIEKAHLLQIMIFLKKMMQDQAQLRHFLSLSFNTLLKNALSRRIFIQFHQKVNSQEFVRILSSQISLSKLLDGNQKAQERNNVLKLIICLKRIATRIGLNSFYDFKIGAYHHQLLKEQKNDPLNQQLMDLLNDVTEEEEKYKN